MNPQAVHQQLTVPHPVGLAESGIERGPVSCFMEEHFRHFNAATLLEAARAYEDLIERGGKMLVALAGAMSTAELGKSLAEMIRQDKVHIISCTGANLEEDVMNLVAHSHYKRIPNWRDLTPEQEQELLRAALQPRYRYLHPPKKKHSAACKRTLNEPGCVRKNVVNAISRTSTSTNSSGAASSSSTTKLIRAIPGWLLLPKKISPLSFQAGKTPRQGTSLQRTSFAASFARTSSNLESST